MTILEIIITILHHLPNGWHVGCVRSYITSLLIWQPSAGVKEKQSHTNKDTHSKLHYWKLVKENGIKEF